MNIPVDKEDPFARPALFCEYELKTLLTTITMKILM